MTVQCPSCATEVPDGMQFCGACGVQLPARCRACGTLAASASQRFCGSCGTPFQQPTAPPRERRLVSVLFCDLVGFTSFSESRDPEDVRDVLEHYFRAARRVVVSYGGTIEKFIGDAVMAVWGTPVTLEDDAERCVRAALDLTAAVSHLAERLAIPEFALRAGILTGEAAVDRNAVHTGMVIGDAVNTASRIQSLAKPGTVLVDDVTRQATERAISYEAAGIHTVKGKTTGVRVWRPTRVASTRGGISAVEPPLVGRNAELGLITDAVDELLAPDPGAGIVTLIGHAGLGKTRLALEAERYSDALADRVRWLYGRALAFGEGAGVSALAEVMRMAAGISLDESPDHQREVVDRWVGDLFEALPDEQPRAVAAVKRLLALDDGEGRIEQGELFSSWRLVLERLASRRPLIIALEELHQADQGLLDFIAHLLEWAPQAPVRVLAFGRPDPRLDLLPELGRAVTLAPLTDPQMNALVLGVVRDAPPELVQAVCADGGGVPLYAVETLRSLLDSGVLAAEDGRYVLRGELGELAIPPTLRALVASRLDRLGHLERRVLNAGAVLGERFPAAGTAQLVGVEEGDTRTLLDALVAKQLLILETAPQSPSRGQYAFLQGLVRRVVLNTLSRRVRRGLHLLAVDYLSEGAAEPELASVLAGHLLSAAELDPAAADAPAIRTRAGITLREAAERAAAVGASEQALSFFDQAVRLTADERERAEILARAGDVADRAGDGEAAAERYRLTAEVHAAAGRERERLGARTRELSALLYVRSPAELLPELRDLDAALGDVADEHGVFARATHAFVLYQCGQPEEALAVARGAVEAAEAFGVQREMLGPLAAEAGALAELERPEESIEVYRRALQIAENNDQRPVPAISGSMAVSMTALGSYADAAAQAREAIAAAQRTGQRFPERWAQLVLGRALCSLGEWEEAVTQIEAVKADVPPFQIGMAVAPLVVIALARGEQGRVRELVDEHDGRCSDGDTSVFESDFRTLRGAVLADLERDDDALATIIPNAEVADYAEWSGWLAPVVDMLVAGADSSPLEAALHTLRGAGRMKETTPVRAQAERLAAHLAGRAGDVEAAPEHWERAQELARAAGVPFDAAVITLERSEHQPNRDDAALAAATETFERLRAEPWLIRARQIRDRLAPAVDHAPGGVSSRTP